MQNHVLGTAPPSCRKGGVKERIRSIRATSGMTWSRRTQHQEIPAKYLVVASAQQSDRFMRSRRWF